MSAGRRVHRRRRCVNRNAAECRISERTRSEEQSPAADKTLKLSVASPRARCIVCASPRISVSTPPHRAAQPAVCTAARAGLCAQWHRSAAAASPQSRAQRSAARGVNQRAQPEAALREHPTIAGPTGRSLSRAALTAAESPRARSPTRHACLCCARPTPHSLAQSDRVLVALASSPVPRTRSRLLSRIRLLFSSAQSQSVGDGRVTVDAEARHHILHDVQWTRHTRSRHDNEAQRQRTRMAHWRLEAAAEC